MWRDWDCYNDNDLQKAEYVDLQRMCIYSKQKLFFVAW